MIHTQTEIDNLVELAIIQRAELKKLVESLPQLRDHLSSEIERNLEEIEPAIRSELEQLVIARAQDAHAQSSAALTAKVDELGKALEVTTAARYSVLMAEREQNATLLAQAEARIAEAASALPSAVKSIVTDELSRFPRAGEIDQLRKEFAEPKGLNPRGKWSPDETYQRLDLVTFNGDSFVSNIDGNRERPSRSAADWTLNAARGNSGGGGGVTSITDLLPIPSSGQILGSEGPNYVPKNLVAGANITITETPTQITIIGTEGQIELTDGTEAAPSLFFVNDTNTGMYRPAADTVGIVGGGHDILRLTDVASATDYIEIKNGTGVGNPLHVLAEGASANIGVHLQPKGTGLFTISDGTDFNKGIRFRSSSSAASAVTLIDAVSTAGRVVTLPDATDTLVGRATTDTLSNKTMIAPALGTPTALVGTNITGTAAGLTAGTVTTNANLTGDVTSVGNATSIAAGVIVDADINASAAIVDTKLATISTAGKVSNSATTAASANTASAIVARDVSGNFSAGTITANLTGNVSGSSGSTTGNAATATALQTARAINGVNFDGTAAITVAAAAGTLTGATLASGVTASSLTSVGTLGSLTVTNPITGSVTGSSGSTTGNAATATALATARAINGVNFDGTSAITVTAAAGTLSGNTLAAGVTASSLTSLGTIASLTATAGTVANAPSGSTDIANKLYVDTVAQGLDAKASCVAATTADITLSGAQTIDGVSVVAGNRVLVKNQSLSQNNGIYLCASGSWTRTTDANTWDALTSAFTFIEQGTVNADTGYVCTANAGGTLGTTALPWSQFSGAGTFTAGTGLTLTGSVFSLTTPVAVANGGTGLTSLGSGVATFLGTPSSANLAAAVTDETGSGSLVFATSPTLVTPNLGAASATSIAASGTVTGSNLSGTNTGDQTTITGNAGSATILQTARNINGVSFNGSADITVTAAAGTLTGATLASGVTASSLTSLGTITSLTATALTVNDNTTLGSSNTDTVVFNARVASDINPSTDDTYDLGVTGHEWRNLNIDGTANIDSLVADTADINGGTIDGTTIGATTPSTVAATTITAQNASFQIVAQTSGSTRMTLDHNGTNGRVGTLDAQDVYIVRANVPVAVFGSTGLNSTAIGATTPSTGAFTTLSATGDSKISKSTPVFTIESTAVDTLGKLAFFDSAAGATSAFLSAGNNGGNFLTSWNRGGVDGAAEYIKMDAFPRVIIGVGGSNVGVFTSTGLAVTGALSATGNLTSLNSRSNGLATTFETGYSDLSAASVFRNASDGGPNLIQFFAGGSKRGEFSATGLAVTGALSATGAATITGAVNSANAFVSTGAVTANAADRVTLDFGSATFGRVLAWGPNNATAGQLDLGVLSANASVGSTSIARVTSTGLAVTGALSCTGALAIGNTVNTVSPTSPNRTVTIVIGGTTYYLAAKTTND